MHALQSIEKKIKPFLDAWAEYKKDIEDFLAKCPGGRGLKPLDERKPSQISPEKFQSIQRVDTEFKRIISPMIKGFFERNPLFGHGICDPSDGAIYKGYQRYLTQETPPRVYYTYSDRKSYFIESQKDIWEYLKKCETLHHVGHVLLNCGEEFKTEWQEYLNFIIALMEREKAVARYKQAGDETPAPQERQGEATGTGGDERQKRNIITIKIEKTDVGLTQTEALCLMALKEELKNRTKYIRPVHITMRVWPDETLKGKNRLKYYWSNLRKKLDARVKLPGFEHFLSKHEGYCLGTKNTPWKPPSWFKNIRFPKNLRLPLVVRPNR